MSLHPTHSTLSQQQTLALGAYPDVTVIRENNAFLMLKSRASAQMGDIATFRFNSYGSNKLLLKLQSHPILGDQDHSNYVHATDAIVKVGAVGSATNASLVQLNTDTAIQYIEVRNAVHGNASNPLRLQLTKTAERDDSFSGETEFEFTLAFVAPTASGITGDANYKLSADVNAANERFGLFSMILIARDSQDAAPQTANVVGRIGMVPHVSIFKVSAPAAADIFVHNTDDFSGTVDREFTVTADGRSSEKFYNFAKIEASLDFATTASFSAAQSTGGIFSVRHAAPVLTANDALKVRSEVQTYPDGATVTQTNGVTTYTFANIAAANTLAASAQFGRLVGAQLYDESYAEPNAFVIHKNVTGTTVSLVVSGTRQQTTIRTPAGKGGPARYIPTSNVTLGAAVAAPADTLAKAQFTVTGAGIDDTGYVLTLNDGSDAALTVTPANGDSDTAAKFADVIRTALVDNATINNKYTISGTGAIVAVERKAVGDFTITSDALLIAKTSATDATATSTAATSANGYTLTKYATASTATFKWSKVGTPFQLNLERNSIETSDKISDNSADPPTNSIEHWNGDRSVDASDMAANWTDGELYELKIDMAGNLPVSTYNTADPTNPTVVSGGATTQWTVTGYTQTVLRGSIEIDTVNNKTKFVVKRGSNGLPEYRPWGTTELVSYTFNGAIREMTADTSVLVPERLTTVGTNTPTFQLSALVGQPHGITGASITLRGFKSRPDAINNLAGALPTVKNKLTVVSNMQESGTVYSTDHGVLTITTPSFLNLLGGSVAGVSSKISSSTNQLILSTKALVDAGATFAVNGGKTECVITLPVHERDVTSSIQTGQKADIITNADTPAVSGTCTSANVTLTTADAATGGKTITITTANGATLPNDFATASYAIMGADSADADRASFANLDAKFAKLQSADESGAKTNLYLNTNQLNKHSGSLVISGSALTGTALKVGSLLNTRGRDVTVTVDREAAFTRDGNRSITTMHVNAGDHGIVANDILSQRGNAVKATVQSIDAETKAKAQFTVTGAGVDATGYALTLNDGSDAALTITPAGGNSDTAEKFAGVIRTALTNDGTISGKYTISGTGAEVVVERKTSGNFTITSAALLFAKTSATDATATSTTASANGYTMTAHVAAISTLLTLKPDYEGHFDISDDLTKWDAGDSKFYLMHDQDVTLPEIGCSGINVGHIIKDKNGVEGKVKTKHAVSGANRTFTLEKNTGLFTTGQFPLRAGAAGSEAILQTNEFKFTTLAATATPADTNAVLQAGTVTGATMNTRNLASVDNQDGTKTHTINVCVTTYTGGATAFNSTGLLTVNGKALKYQEVKLSGDGTASSAVNANQTIYPGRHIKINDTLTGKGAVKAIKVKLTLGAPITTAIAKGDTITQRSGETVGTSTAAHNANTLIAGSQLELLVTTDTKPFDATGTGITVGANTIAVTACETTLLVDNTLGDLAANDNPKVTGKVGGSAQTIQLQEITLNNQYTTAGVVGQTLALDGTRATRTVTIAQDDPNNSNNTYAITVNDTAFSYSTGAAQKTKNELAASLRGLLNTATTSASKTFTFTAAADAANQPFTITINGVDCSRTAGMSAGSVGGILKDRVVAAINGGSLAGFTATNTGSPDTLTITGPSPFTYVANAALAAISSNLTTTSATAPTNGPLVGFTIGGTGAAIILTGPASGAQFTVKGDTALAGISDLISSNVATTNGIATVNATIKKVTVDGTNTKYMLENNSSTDFSTAKDVTVNGISNQYQRLTVDANIKTHLGDLPTANAIVQRTGNADAGNATVTASDNTNKYIYATNNTGAAFVASTIKTGLTVNQAGWAQAAKAANVNIILSAFNNGDVAPGMYVTGSGIAPNTKVVTATHGNNTITLDKASALDHAQALHFHDDTIKLAGESHPAGFVELDISGLVASHGFILPPANSVVSQGAVTGTVQSTSASGKIILKTAGTGAIANGAFTTATNLKVNIGGAGATEQKFQKITVTADNSVLGKLSDLTAIATINDTTAGGLITQLNNNGVEVARGQLRALAGAVATVQVTSGTFTPTATFPLKYGGRTHRYVTLTLPTANILATEKNSIGRLQNGHIVTDGVRTGIVRSSSTNGSNTLAVVEYTTSQASGNITNGNLTINSKFQATQTITVTSNDNIFSDDILPNVDTVITQGSATGTVLSKTGQVLTVRLSDAVIFANNQPLTYNGIVHNRVVLTLSAALGTDSNLNSGNGFAANAKKWVYQVGSTALGQTLLNENGTTLTLTNVTGTFNNTGNLKYASTKSGAASGTLLVGIKPNGAGVSTDFVGSVSGSTILVASANTQVLQRPVAATSNPGLKPAVSGKYYALSAVGGATQVQPSAVSIGQLSASAVTNRNATPLNADGTAYSGKNETLDFVGSGVARQPVAASKAKAQFTVNGAGAASTPYKITLNDNGAASKTFTFSAAADAANQPFTITINGVAISRTSGMSAGSVGAIMKDRVVAAINGGSLVGFTATSTSSPDTLTINGPSSFTYVANAALANISNLTTTAATAGDSLLTITTAADAALVDDASKFAGVIRAALTADVAINNKFNISGTGANVIVEGKTSSSDFTIAQDAALFAKTSVTAATATSTAASANGYTMTPRVAAILGQTRRTVASILSPSFKVTPAVASKLTNTGQFGDNSLAPITATYIHSNVNATSQDLAFQFGHGSYAEQIAAFRFRATVTCGQFSEKFNVTVHTFSTPSLYFSKYLKTDQKSFVDAATNYEEATISTTTGNVQVGGSDSNGGNGTLSSKWQVFREDAASTFFQHITGTAHGFAQVNSRLGGGISDYLPILESETLVVASKSGQDVFFKHKSTYDLYDLSGTPAEYPVSADIAKVITSRNLANGSNDKIRVGNADYALAEAAAVVEAVSGINQLKITFKNGVNIGNIAAGQALNLKLAGATTKHNRFALSTSANGAVTNTSVGPFKVHAVAANWASSEASAGDAYSEKVLLVYHDDTDDKSYVVSSVEVGLQVANTDDSNHFQIKSDMNAETIKVFREDVIAYPSTTDGLPVIFASATGGDEAYTFSLVVTGVVSSLTSNGTMKAPTGRAIQGTALTNTLFVSTGDVTSYNYSTGADPSRILTASVNLRDHASSIGASGLSETFAVTYQPTQTFKIISGFTSQVGATIGNALTTNVTVLSTTGAITGFSDGGVHAWDRGIGNNVDLASVNVDRANAITFDNKGLALKVHMVTTSGQTKLKLTTTSAWSNVDNAATGAGKSTRTVTYGLQGDEASYYRMSDRFITGHATGTDGGAASNRYFMTTTGMVAGKTLKGYLEYQAAEKTTTANGLVTGNTTKIVTVADKGNIAVGDSLMPTNVISRGTVNGAVTTITAPMTVESISGGSNAITLTSADSRFTGVQIADGAALTFRETHTVTVGMVSNVLTHNCSGASGSTTLNLDTENTNVVVGMAVSGTGIPAGTTVSSRTNLALVLSSALTGAIANGAITFRGDGYVYQADNGTIENATLIANGIREGGKFTIVSGAGVNNAIPGRAFASNSIDVHVYRDASFRLEDTTTSNATRNNLVSSDLTGTGAAGQKIVAMSNASTLVVGMVVGPTLNLTNASDYINPIADDTTITQISGNNITLSNNLVAALNSQALTFYSVPQRTIHGSVSSTTDTRLIRYRLASTDGKTGVGNATTFSVVGSGLHADAQTAVTIADGTSGSLISVTGDKIFANTPTAYTSEVVVKVQDVNAAAVAQLGGNGIPFGIGVAQHTQRFKLKVIPDPVLGSKTNALSTINVFDKLLVHDANIFKVKMNYFADSFNKASMTFTNGVSLVHNCSGQKDSTALALDTANANVVAGMNVSGTSIPDGTVVSSKTGLALVLSNPLTGAITNASISFTTVGMSTINASKADISAAGTLDLVKSGIGGVKVVSATIGAPKTVHTDLNFLKLNIDGSNGYVADTHQPMSKEITYTSVLSDVSKAGANDSNYADITGNVLLTSKSTGDFLAKMTRHHTPQILQNAKKTNAAITNVNGQRFTHSASTQTHKASWNFTEYTGLTLGGATAATTDHYHSIYTVEKSNGNSYAHDDPIITTNHGNGLYPNMLLTSNTTSDGGKFTTVKLTDQPKFASSIADGATIPTTLTDDESYLKATFKFTSNNLSGEGEESVTYNLSDKLTTKAHPHIRFNHRTSGSNTSTIQSESESSINLGKAGKLPWLVYTADNLATEHTPAKAQFTVTGAGVDGTAYVLTLASPAGTLTITPAGGNSDTAEKFAGVIRAALTADGTISGKYTISGTGAVVAIERKGAVISIADDNFTIKQDAALFAKTSVTGVSFVQNCSGLNTSTTLTLDTANANVVAGLNVSGTGIQAGTVVSSKSGLALVLSKPLAGAITNGSISFTSTPVAVSTAASSNGYTMTPYVACQKVPFADWAVAGDSTATTSIQSDTTGKNVSIVTGQTKLRVGDPTAYAETDAAYKNVFLRRALAGYDGPKGFARDADGIRLTISEKPVVTVLNRENEANGKYLGLTSTSVNALRNGIKTGNKVHPIGNLITEDPTQAHFDVGNADGAAGKNDVALTFGNGLASFKAVGHGDTSDYPGFHFSDVYTVANGTNGHFNGTAGSVGFLRVNNGAMSVEANTANIQTRFTKNGGFSDEPVAAASPLNIVKRVARDNNGGFTFSASGKTIKEMDANGHTFFVHNGRRVTGGALTTAVQRASVTITTLASAPNEALTFTMVDPLGAGDRTYSYTAPQATAASASITINSAAQNGSTYTLTLDGSTLTHAPTGGHDANAEATAIAFETLLNAAITASNDTTNASRDTTFANFTVTRNTNVLTISLFNGLSGPVQQMSYQGNAALAGISSLPNASLITTTNATGGATANVTAAGLRTLLDEANAVGANARASRAFTVSGGTTSSNSGVPANYTATINGVDSTYLVSKAMAEFSVTAAGEPNTSYVVTLSMPRKTFTFNAAALDGNKPFTLTINGVALTHNASATAGNVAAALKTAFSNAQGGGSLVGFTATHTNGVGTDTLTINGPDQVNGFTYKANAALAAISDVPATLVTTSTQNFTVTTDATNADTEFKFAQLITSTLNAHSAINPNNYSMSHISHQNKVRFASKKNTNFTIALDAALVAKTSVTSVAATSTANTSANYDNSVLGASAYQNNGFNTQKFVSADGSLVATGLKAAIEGNSNLSGLVVALNGAQLTITGPVSGAQFSIKGNDVLAGASGLTTTAVTTTNGGFGDNDLAGFTIGGTNADIIITGFANGENFSYKGNDKMALRSNLADTNTVTTANGSSTDYVLSTGALNGLSAGTGATLVAPPRLAYQSTAAPSTNTTDTFDITYTQNGSKLLSTDSAHSSIASEATTLTFNVFKNLNETIHIADNTAASSWVSNNNANTGLALSGKTLTDATERNYYYAQTLTPSVNNDKKLLAVYFNRSEDLAQITDGSARVANKIHGNLHSITKDDGTLNKTNHSRFELQTRNNRSAFGVYLKDTTEEAAFKGTTGTMETIPKKTFTFNAVDITHNCSGANGSTTLNLDTANANVVAGMVVTGTGVPADTTVSSKNGLALVVSNALTGAITNGSITFRKNGPFTLTVNGTALTHDGSATEGNVASKIKTAFDTAQTGGSLVGFTATHTNGAGTDTLTITRTDDSSFTYVANASLAAISDATTTTATTNGLTMKLKPNGFSTGELTLAITKLSSVNAPMTESLNNSTGLGNVATVSGGVVVYDPAASTWQTVVPDSTSSNTTSDAPANVWAAYGDGTSGTGSVYNAVTGTQTFDSKTSPLWSMATIDPTNAQTALTGSNVAFSSTTASHGVTGEQWASLAGGVQSGANGATNNSSANALFQRYYADADKVKTLSHPNWVGDGGRHKLDPSATITGAFRIPLENTGSAGTYNVADNSTTTDLSTRGTNNNATNTVTLSREANTYNATVVVKMTSPQKFSLSSKPSLVRHPDDVNLGAVTARGRSKIMPSGHTASTTALAHFAPESGGVLGNRILCFTDMTDLRDALVADGKRQLSDKENRFELDSTPTALARTSTVVGVDRYNDVTPARRFQLEEHNGKATLSVVLSGADAFYKRRVTCVMELDTLGESPNDIRVGDYVYQSGLSYSKGVAPNNKTYVQTFGKVIQVSSTNKSIKVEFAGLEVNDLYNKAIMDSNFATKVNATNPGARRGWSQPGYQKSADKTNGETHGDGSAVSHIPFIVSGGVTAKKLTLIRGYVESTNTTSNNNVKAFQAFTVASVVISTDSSTRRLSVNSAMVGRLGSGKSYALYAESVNGEGEQFVDLKITKSGGPFNISESAISDTATGVYGDARYGDVTVSDSFQIGKFDGTDHSSAAEGGFKVTHDSGDKYTFRLNGTANNTWSTVSQVTSGTGSIAGGALTTLTLSAANTLIKPGMVVHGHSSIVAGTTVTNITGNTVTLSKNAGGAITNQALKFSNDLASKLLQNADLSVLHTSFVVRENEEGDTVFIWRIDNTPTPTATQFTATLIGGIGQTTGNTLGLNVLALGGGQGSANQVTAKSMRSQQNVALLPFYTLQTIAPNSSSDYPHSAIPETTYTREVKFNNIVPDDAAGPLFQMDMTAGNTIADIQAQWGNASTTITLASADVADLRFGSTGTKSRTASLTNGSPTITLLGHVEATTTTAATTAAEVKAKAQFTVNGAGAASTNYSLLLDDGTPVSKTFTFTAAADAANQPFTITINGVDCSRTAGMSAGSVGGILKDRVVAAINGGSLAGFTATNTGSPDTLTITGPSSFTYVANAALANISSNLTTTAATAGGLPLTITTTADAALVNDASKFAGVIRAALTADVAINNKFDISGTGAVVAIQRKTTGNFTISQDAALFAKTTVTGAAATSTATSANGYTMSPYTVEKYPIPVPLTGLASGMVLVTPTVLLAVTLANNQAYAASSFTATNGQKLFFARSATNNHEAKPLSVKSFAAGASSIELTNADATIIVGTSVSGPGIATGTVVTSIASNTLTLSNNTTSSGSGYLLFAASIFVGMTATGNVPAGTHVTAVNGNTISLSANATATATAQVSFSNIGPGAYLTTTAGAGIPADTHVVTYNGDKTVTINHRTSAAQGNNTAVSFKLDSQYDNIAAIQGGTSFTPESYIYRLDRHLKTYKIEYVQNVISAAFPLTGHLTLHTEQGGVSTDRTQDTPTKDSHNVNLVDGRRYLVLAVDYADRGSDGNPVVDTTYNGYYTYNSTSEVFVYDNSSGVSDANFGMDTNRVDLPETSSELGPFRMAIIPTGSSGTYQAHPGGYNGNQANTDIGGVFSTSSTLRVNDDMKEIKSNGATKPTFQRMTQLIRNEGAEYARGTTNGFPHYRIHDVPSRLDQSDLVIVLLRADANTGANNLTLKYDRIMNGDVIQSYQLRGAVDYSGMSSDMDWTGNQVVGTITNMPLFYQNVGTELNPTAKRIGLSLASPSSLANADAAIFANQDLRSFQFLHSSNSGTSLRYTRGTTALVPTGTSSSVNVSVYDSTKKVYMFAPANRLTFDESESLPLFD